MKDIKTEKGKKIIERIEVNLSGERFSPPAPVHCAHYKTQLNAKEVVF